MGIQFNDALKSFKIDAKDTSYIISIVDEEQFLGHVYFGEKIPDQDMNHLLRLEENPFVPSKNNRVEVLLWTVFLMSTRLTV